MEDKRNILNQKLTNNIKKLLKEKNLTLTDLSKGAKISYNTLLNYFNKKTLPRAKQLFKIAVYLDCSIDFLIGRTNKK